MQSSKNEQAKLSWDDLRVVLAVAKAGSLTGAAVMLGSSHPTVFRRVRAIEKALGVRLFERNRSGYSATDAAAEIVTLAEQIEADVQRVELSVAGRDERPAGLVRVTMTDTLMFQLFPPILATLCASLPAIQVEISTTNALFSLTKREADIAIRLGHNPPDHLVGRRVCGVAVSIYGPMHWPDASMSTLDQFPWIAPDDSLSHLASFRWLADRGLNDRAVVRSNSMVNMVCAANAGLGLSILSCYLGDRAPGLRRLCPPMKQFQTELWILSHPELRRVRRVNAFIEKLLPALGAYADLFEGRLPGSA